MIEALDAVAPQVTPPPAPADVPAADPADSVFLLDVPEHDQRDDHHSDDASDDRGSDGEIHLDPLVELPDGSGVRATGRSRGRVTTSVQFAALASAALGVALVAGLVQLNRRLESFATTGDAGPVDDADRLVERILQPAFFVCALVLVVGLVWWTRLRRFEMRALGIREARFSDGLAGASWLIPGANLVMSTMVLGEMWRTSRAVRRGGEWDDEPASPWLFSWALLVGAGAVVAIAAATVDPVTIPGIIDANTWSGIGYALMSLGLLALALTISAVARSVRVSLRVAQVQPDRLDVDLVEPDPVMA